MASDGLRNEVISTMIRDDISRVAKHDEVVLAFGESLNRKLGRRQANHISQRMRQLARLVLQLRKDNGNEDSQLRDYINPERFDVVVGAVKEVSRFDQADTTKVGVPSMALKLGHSLTNCAAIVRGIGLGLKCATTIENAGYFLELMKDTWSEEISTHALTTLGERKFNQPEILPVNEELLKVRKITF
ncbi:hypothetical protein HOLleu_01508 [Holothuria leucospilota]|uniref:Uncharacterized protein n=1 Tax=Holothuria leucospilota TaxID=206669 RepID=A0A9Q1CR38_HOLLE|nr:hypothetical protein HOLleu_01508 [Holothuria leucospilota]